MAIAGRVAIVPKGDWSADATYKRLDAVTHNNTLYFAKKDVPAGTATSNTEYWSKSIVGGAGGVATADEAGVVKPADGLTIAEDGTLKVSIDGTTLTMDQVNNVIKLADTLKDAINGALPAANVANNQITTVEGFALDARQANPNLGGTLAKQISDLNGSLNTLNGYVISRVHDFLIRDNESKNISVSPGAYLFINGHIYAPQITLLRITNDHDCEKTHIIQPSSSMEVTISGRSESMTFKATGLCYGFLVCLISYD